MEREEAIKWLTNEKWKNANNKYKKEWNEAFDMAIEALSADAEVKYSFIPMNDENLIEVVRCKDCRHAHECHKSVQYTRNEPRTVTIGYAPIEWCSRGERQCNYFGERREP